MIDAFWKSRGKKTHLNAVSLASHGQTAKSIRRIFVEEQDRIESQEDVEGHRNKHKPQASEDTPKDEGTSEDFELHRSHHKPQASDTPKDEGEDEGDFELHRKGHRAL
jgi:hypothetical protein